ncbi:hypothetical protein G6F56_008072 [Rhizopus delemar]|nr:hypothetical protein G6F56_008072 [Rhizopus delemar]
MSKLPQEIIYIIFQNLQKQEAMECRLVCLAWYEIGTQKSFENLVIADDWHLENFLKLFPNSLSYRLISTGKFVKTILIGTYRYTEKTNFSYDTFEALVKYCPYVERLDAEEERLWSYMLDINDRIQWKYLKELPPICNHFDHCIKYSKCLTKLTTGMEHQRDTSFLSFFQTLKSLCLPSSLPVTTIQDLQFIVQKCPKLASLHVSLVMMEKFSQSVYHPLCSPLKQLIFQDYKSNLPPEFARYISEGLVHLTRLQLIIDSSHNNFSLDDAYDRLVDYAMTRLQKTFNLCLTIKAFRDKQNRIDRLIRRFMQCMFIPNFTENKNQKIHNILSIRRGDSKDFIDLNAAWTRHSEDRLVCHLQLTWPMGASNLFTYLEYAVGSIHEIIFTGQLHVLYTQTLNHNSQHAKVSFQHGFMRFFPLPPWKSVNTVVVSKSHVTHSFFHDLSLCYSHLEALCLKENNYQAETQALSSSLCCLVFQIDLQNMTLDRLEMDTLSKEQDELLIIDTLYGSASYFVEAKGSPKLITQRTSSDMCKTTSFSRTYFSCFKLGKVIINGVIFQLDCI